MKKPKKKVVKKSKVSAKQKGKRNFVKDSVAIDKADLELDKMAGSYVKFVK